MKFLKLLFVLAMVMALSTTAFCATTPPLNEDDDNNASNQTSYFPTSIGRAGRFLAQISDRAAKSTCDKHPKICRNEGSPGPFCCNKKCVDIKTDKFNCGKCGKKCGYTKICCQGKCVNPLSNELHCGGCNNPCGKGNSCLYGICNYA